MKKEYSMEDMLSTAADWATDAWSPLGMFFKNERLPLDPHAILTEIKDIQAGIQRGQYGLLESEKTCELERLDAVKLMVYDTRMPRRRRPRR